MKWLDKLLAPWRQHPKDLSYLNTRTQSLMEAYLSLHRQYLRFMQLAPEPDTPDKRADSDRIGREQIARLLAEDAARRHITGEGP